MITSAALGNGMPPEIGIMFGSLEIASKPKAVPQALYSGGAVTPSYFSTLRIPVLSGRSFDPTDIDGSDRVVVINQSLAAKFWQGRSPLGDKLRLDAESPMATIIGVVRPSRLTIWATTGPARCSYTFRGRRQSPLSGRSCALAASPAALIPALKASVWGLDARLPIREITTGRDLMKRSTSRQRFNPGAAHDVRPFGAGGCSRLWASTA